jgi:secreted Zn-dependent insulinase-like peptidase
MPRVPAPPTACAVNVFCHGNTSTAQAKEMIEEAAKALGSAPLNLSQLPAPRLLQLPENVEVVLRLHPSLYTPEQLSLFNADEPNSAVEVSLQAELDARPQTLIVELLCHILANPAFEQLRTKEQLGYIVQLGMRHDLGVVGLRVIAQSSYDPVHLDERIEAFLGTVPTLLAELSDEAFGNHKEALITAKKEAPKTLRDESGVYWHEIATSTYDFHRDAKDVQECEKLTKQMLLDYWHRMFDAKTSTCRRKLSAQMYAGSLELPPRLASGVGGRKVHYVDGFDAVCEYKRSLAAFPCAPRCDKDGNLLSGWA